MLISCLLAPATRDQIRLATACDLLALWIPRGSGHREKGCVGGLGLGVRTSHERRTIVKGICGCGSPFLRLFDDLGCVGCGRQCCWGCAVVIESVVYCGRCAESLLEVSPSFAESVSPSCVA